MARSRKFTEAILDRRLRKIMRLTGRLKRIDKAWQDVRKAEHAKPFSRSSLDKALTRLERFINKPIL